MEQHLTYASGTIRVYPDVHQENSERALMCSATIYVTLLNNTAY